MADWYSTLGGKHLSDPASIARWLDGQPLTADLGFWRRANSYDCPVGPDPGAAYVLMRRARLDELDWTAYHNLVFRSQYGSTTLKGLIITRAYSMFGRTGDSKSPMLVDLRDRRHTAMRSVINKGYNVPIPAPPNSATPANRYYPDTLDGGQPWTWTRMVADIWGHLTDVGGVPALPVTPVTAPFDFRFFGMGAWKALHCALGTVGLTTAFDPLVDLFSIIQPGATQGLAAAVASLEDRLRRDFDPPEFTSNKPASITVFFAKKPKYYGIQRDTPRIDNHEADPVHAITLATGIAGAKGVQGFNCDVAAYIDHDGAVANLSELQSRAADILASVQTNTAEDHNYVFAGALASIRPAGEVTSIIWRDYGDASGQVTEIERYFPGPIASAQGHGSGGERTPEFDSIKPGDYGRATHPIYPHVAQTVHLLDETKAAGRVVLPFQATLLHGSAHSIWVFPGKVRLIRAGLEVLEACWIAYMDCYDDLMGNLATYNGQILQGRLSGTATDGQNEYPLYLVESLEPVLVQPDDCLIPPAGSSVTGKVMEFIGGAWVESTIPTTIYSSNGRNALTPEDPPVWAQFHPASKRMEILGEHGTYAHGTTNAEIPCGQSGAVTIHANEGMTGGTCLGEPTNCVVPDVCNNLTMSRNILKGEHVELNYDPRSNRWYVSDCDMPDATAVITDDMCPDAQDATIGISGFTYLQNCGPSGNVAFPKPAVAENIFKLSGLSGAKVFLVYRQTEKDWIIVQIEHRCMDIMAVDCEAPSQGQKPKHLTFQSDPCGIYSRVLEKTSIMSCKQPASASQITMYNDFVVTGPFVKTDTTSGSQGGVCKITTTALEQCFFRDPTTLDPATLTVVMTEANVVLQDVRQKQGEPCLEGFIVTVHAICWEGGEWTDLVCGSDCVESGS